MPRLRHAQTGVVVNVDDDAASRLDANWGDADTVPVPPVPGPASTPAPSTPALSTPAPTPASPSGEPRGNGSREEWAAYADSLGVTYDPEAKRGDIKDAIAAAADAADGDDSTPQVPTDPVEPETAPEGDDK